MKATSIWMHANTQGNVMAEGAVLTLSQHWIHGREESGMSDASRPGSTSRGTTHKERTPNPKKDGAHDRHVRLEVHARVDLWPPIDERVSPRPRTRLTSNASMGEGKQRTSLVTTCDLGTFSFLTAETIAAAMTTHSQLMATN